MEIIKIITLYDYIMDFGSSGDALLDYSVKLTMASDKRSGLLLGLYVDSKPAGLLVTAIRPLHSMNLVYLYVKEELRGRNYSKALLNGAVKEAREKHVLKITARVIPSNRYGSLIVSMLSQFGFSHSNSSSVLRCVADEKGKEAWAAFMADKGNKIVKHLEQRGFITLTYAEAPEMLDEVANNRNCEFPRYLTPVIYKNSAADRLVYDYSFIVLKNGNPVAYSTATTADGRTMVFQQLAAAEGARGTGAFLLPIVACVEKIIAEGKYEKISYTVYDSNAEMKNLAKGFLLPLAESVKIQNFYQLILNDAGNHP